MAVHGTGWLTGLAPALPDWIGADLDRRAVVRSERLATRYARRAAGSARWWTIAAAVTPVAAAVDHEWAWLAVGAVALMNGALWAREAALANRRDPGLPLPSVPAPGLRSLRGSAAAEPLRRGEAAIVAFAAMARASPPGPTAAAVRCAMASAGAAVDGLRLRAARVTACEAAARAVANPARRAELSTIVRALVDDMTAAVRALDDLLGAAGDVIGAVSPRPHELAALGDATEALRGYAAAWRELAP